MKVHNRDTAVKINKVVGDRYVKECVCRKIQNTKFEVSRLTISLSTQKKLCRVCEIEDGNELAAKIFFYYI